MPDTQSYTLQRLHLRKMTSLLGALMFLAALLPLAAHFVFFHPDEINYANGALIMIHNGDVLTPRTGEGFFRFNKPILTYWAVLGSYQLLGSNALSTRLPFLLAGGVVIWLTYRLSLKLFGCRHTSLVSSMLVATHPLMMMAGVRANPDMLLMLWTTLSAYGFLSILISDKAKVPDYLYAYLGAGLAVATKGPFPILVLVVSSMAFLCLNPWRRIGWRQLIHLPSISLGLLVGAGWFIAIYLLHGDTAIAGFFGDHVGSRIGLSPGAYFLNIFVAVASIVIAYLPWWWLFWGRNSLQNRIAQWSPRDQAVIGFCILWSLCMVAMSAVVTPFFFRYLLPVLILPSIVVARLLVGEKNGNKISIPSLPIRLLLLPSLLLLTAAVVLHWLLASSSLSLLPIVAAIVIWSYLFFFSTKDFEVSAIVLAGTFFMVPLALYLLARPIALPDQGSRIVQQMQQMALIGKRSVVYSGRPGAACKIRIAAGPTLDLLEVKGDRKIDIKDFDALIYLNEPRGDWDVGHYQLSQAVPSWGRFPLGEILTSGSFSLIRERLNNPDQKYFVAIPPRP